jgi:inosine-uridine nucleoside N-ribohydrolase
MVAADIHGISGLDGTDLLPEPDEDIILRNEKAVLHMAQVLRDHPTKVTIVAVGPYTNVALLLTLFPELKQKIEKISLMGGGIAGGNRTPVAEFNVLVRSPSMFGHNICTTMNVCDLAI